MIRGRGFKVKKFVLNGSIERLYGTKCPANGIRKWLDFKVFGIAWPDKRQKSAKQFA
jgi:hypothetical protein